MHHVVCIDKDVHIPWGTNNEIVDWALTTFEDMTEISGDVCTRPIMPILGIEEAYLR